MIPSSKQGTTADRWGFLPDIRDITDMIRKHIFGIFIALLPLALIFGPEIPHNVALYRFRSHFKTVTHPSSSTLLKRFSDVGLLEGNGNHCDYLVGHVRETDEPPDQIVDHYIGGRYPRVDPSFDSGFGASVPLHVEFPDSNPSGLLTRDMPKMIQAARAKQKKKTLYVVYAFDGGYPPNFDWRCH